MVEHLAFDWVAYQSLQEAEHSSAVVALVDTLVAAQLERPVSSFDAALDTAGAVDDPVRQEAASSLAVDTLGEHSAET